MGYFASAARMAWTASTTLAPSAVSAQIQVHDLAGALYRHCGARAPQWHSIHCFGCPSRTHVEGVIAHRADALYRHRGAQASQWHSIYCLACPSRTHVEGVIAHCLVIEQLPRNLVAW